MDRRALPAVRSLSESLASASIDRIGDAVYWMDSTSRIIHVNNAACAMLGYSKPEFLSMTIFDIDAGGRLNFSDFAAALEALKANGPIRFETTHKAKDGRIVPVEVAGAAAEVEGTLYSFSYCRDIGERKRIEAELEMHRGKLEELVAERTAELQRALEELLRKEKLAALGNLVAGVAHELNTPLGNARMVASTLESTIDTFVGSIESGSINRTNFDAFIERIRGAAELLERNTGRAAELIAQFKLVAVDQSSERRRQFDLKAMIHDILGTMRPLLKGAKVDVSVDIPDGIVLDSYPGPVGQIVANLVENGLSHGLRGSGEGSIRIRASTVGRSSVAIEVADDGAGVPEEIRTRIFEPFFTTKLGSGGSGLGLYLVHTMATGVLGGSVRLAARDGPGAAFILEIPLVAP